MISSSLQSALNGKARTSGVFFNSEIEADQAVRDLKAEGAGNPRKAKFLDHEKTDGTKVFCWVVRINR